MVDSLLLIILGPKKMDTKITYRHQTVFLNEIVCFQWVFMWDSDWYKCGMDSPQLNKSFGHLFIIQKHNYNIYNI